MMAQFEQIDGTDNVLEAILIAHAVAIAICIVIDIAGQEGRSSICRHDLHTIGEVIRIGNLRLQVCLVVVQYLDLGIAEHENRAALIRIIGTRIRRIEMLDETGTIRVLRPFCRIEELVVYELVIP